MFEAIPNMRRTATALIPRRHILLLSHMRAYTSLFGHIMGSNPAICGYYEMHIGYHSWKSLIRQKLLYFRDEEPKPGFSSMFDKVLHNDHEVSLRLLNSSRVTTIFSLRPPRTTIPSILRLYQETDPAHEFNSESFATHYYIERLNTLEKLAGAMQREFYYMDAEAIKCDAEHCLEDLSRWLHLDAPLTPYYDIQRKTSKKKYGDTSDRMTSGRITEQGPVYENFRCDEHSMHEAVAVYQRVRRALVDASAAHCIIDAA